MSSASMAYLLAREQKQSQRKHQQLVSSNSSPKSSTSFDSERTLYNPSSKEICSKFKKIVKKVVQHAKEHHESVEAAYAVYYGQGGHIQQRTVNFGRDETGKSGANFGE